MKENNIIPQKIENENRKFILFEINNIKYAIDASYVVELMHIPKFETPNKMSKYIAGVMPYDPVSINIIDIRPILNIKIEKYKLNDSLIILKTSENIFGIIVNKIIDKFIKQLQDRLVDRKITITVSDRAKEIISQQGYDVTFGARPLKRFIQSNIETLVAREMIKGDIKHGSHVTVDYDNNFFITVN